ncbi:MAG: TonB-dependent receptor [Bacteroidales bacterium]
MRKKYLLLLVFSALFIGLRAQTDTTSLRGKSIRDKDPNFPVIDINDAELDNEDSQSGDISGLLSASRDVVVNTAGYNFGRTRFRLRGYDSEYNTVLFNNIIANDPISGRPYWSVWGGLNDVTRNKVESNGISSNQFNFGGIGQTVNLDARPSSMRPGFRFTYSQLNGSYRSRLMGTYSSGLTKNGWAFTVSGSRRWANEGYVEGTFYDAYSYFLGIEKKFSDNHSVSLISFGSPSKRGKSGVSTQEAYDLAGTNYYNPNWGYQNGEKRNARVSDANQPMIILSDYLKFSENTKLTTSLAYSFGHYNSTALNWHGYVDPRPDYYKKLPSYFSNSNKMDEYQKALGLWSTKEGRQLDWDAMININRGNMYKLENAEGIEGNTIYGNRSNYIVENRVAERNRWSFSSFLNSAINDHVKLTFGVNGSLYKERRYKLVDDLLGGDFFMDVDKFAERDFQDASQSYSDIRKPNHVVREGDKFGYDYTANVNQFDVFGQADFTYSKFDFYLGANATYTSMWRTGHMQNGKHPNNSLGDSDKENFVDFGTKAGVVYKLSGRHLLTVNALYMSKAPVFRSAFISPRTRNDVVQNLDSEKILSGDFNYIIRTPYFKSRASVYYTKFMDQTWQRSFYNEDVSSYTNYIMTGVDKVNMGVELGMEAQVIPTVSVTGVLSLGDYRFDSKTDVLVANDNGTPIESDYGSFTDEKGQLHYNSYLKGQKVGGFPQSAASIGVKYSSPRYWYAGANANLFWDIYTDFNPDRRSAAALSGYTQQDNPAFWQKITDREELDPGFTVDMFVGKSWKINDYYIRLNANVNNLFDVKDFAIGGFEQLRYDKSNIDRFPSKYFYLYGRSYYVSLTFSF